MFPKNVKQVFKKTNLNVQPVRLHQLFWANELGYEKDDAVTGHTDRIRQDVERWSVITFYGASCNSWRKPRNCCVSSSIHDCWQTCFTDSIVWAGCSLRQSLICNLFPSNISNINSVSLKDKKQFLSNIWLDVLQKASWKHGCWNRSSVSLSDPNCLQRSPQNSGCDVGSWRFGCFVDQWRKFDNRHEAENRHAVLTGRYKHTIIFTDTTHRCRSTWPTVDKLVQ